MSVPLKKSKRKVPRYSVPVPCLVQVIKSPLKVQAQINDLSLKGMSFYWDSQVLPNHSEVRVQIFVANSQPVFAIGKIANVRTEGRAIRYAIQFEFPLSEDAMQTILQGAVVIRRAA
jgi:hypothetical protein